MQNDAIATDEQVCTSRNFFGSKSVLTWTVVLAVLVGISFSMRWMYPLWMESQSQDYAYIPIRYAPGTETDHIVYYSVVRDVLDGRLLFHDSVYENHRLTDAMKRPEASYHLSLIMCSVGGLFTNSTEHAFYFNHFILPAVNFLLMSLLIQRITGCRYLPMLLAATIIVFPDGYLPHTFFKNLFLLISSVFNGSYDLLAKCQLARTPNNQFTNIHLFVFVILMHSYFCKNIRTIGVYIGLGVVLAMSSLIGTSNLLLCYSMFTVAIVFFRIKGIDLKRMAVLYGLTLVFCLPGILVSTQMKSVFNDAIVYNTQGYRYGIVTMDYLLNFFCLAVVPAFLLCFFKIPQKKFILALLVGCIIPYIFVTLQVGSYYAMKLFVRGSRLLISCLVLSSFISVLRVCCKNGVFEKLFVKIQLVSTIKTKLFNNLVNNVAACRAMICIGAVSIMLVAILNQYTIYRSHYYDYNGPAFQGLCDWTRKAVGRDDVLVTMDSDLYINLPVYAPGFMYVPAVLHSGTDHEERFARFFEAMKFYGVPSDQFDSVIGGVMSYVFEAGAGPFEVRRGLTGRLLFFGKYVQFPIGKVEHANLKNTYRDMFEGDNNDFSYKADYWITSKFDRHWIKSRSRAGRIIAQAQPVFQNSIYSVYRLPAKDGVVTEKITE